MVELRQEKDNFQLGQSVTKWPINRSLKDLVGNDCQKCFAGDRNDIRKEASYKAKAGHELDHQKEFQQNPFCNELD